MAEQQKSDKVTRTRNNSEQDNGIKKNEKKILGIEGGKQDQVRLK